VTGVNYVRKTCETMRKQTVYLCPQYNILFPDRTFLLSRLYLGIMSELI